jgi:hypothetical protein
MTIVNSDNAKEKRVQMDKEKQNNLLFGAIVETIRRWL